MKTKSYWRYKIHFNIYQIFGFIFLIILFFGVLFFFKFNKKITPNLLTIAEASINKLNETVLTNYRVKDIYPEVDLEEAIRIIKNNKDEIISVDFDLENVYKALSIITMYLQKSLENVSIRKNVLKYYNEDLSSDLDSIILTIPMGVASEEIYLANLGPRIPVKITYMGYVASSVRIKIEDYGINNALVSVFIDFSITNEFIIPTLNRQINHEYNILVASKIIQGIVPAYYGGVLETKSNILNVPIN